MNDLIKKLEEQINAMSHLLAGTQAGESQAWIELNQVASELKIEVNKTNDEDDDKMDEDIYIIN
jgi:hypothetical protein